ncbi:MAG: tRNA (adenosine(37)-N6)-threonylcarbamoyltransferase complex dimerization subunit type 1 TsaB, partial [Candidatus Delongbacteria bacterium]|nr:tRNA (adenosine(37)-N6)-threonylcarbamoyltransferase complex dimerization subunit type 1 TsaB [Candidatus Delongbacteria bacterium]MCG2760228.1 tRNA (adenosine(37)-N6)-threonylcarbamoyltransferase complex dimerization subunit type 1 TsaB [Candidatus Delongbacteria bacterium]
MYILAVDTSTEIASVSILKNDTVVFEIADFGNRAHNQRLFDMIKESVVKCNIALNEIDLFAVGVGPGSFTGLRVGVSAIKGIAIGLNKKIIPIPSIDSVALNAFENYPAEKYINVILEGRQKDFFHSKYSLHFNDIKKISEIVVHPYEEYSYINGITVGNVPKEVIGLEKYYDGYNPNAVYIGRLAYARKEKGS